MQYIVSLIVENMIFETVFIECIFGIFRRAEVDDNRFFFEKEHEMPDIHVVMTPRVTAFGGNGGKGPHLCAPLLHHTVELCRAHYDQP